MHPEDVVEVIRDTMDRSETLKKGGGRLSGPMAAVQSAVTAPFLPAEEALRRIEKLTKGCGLGIQAGHSWQKYEPTGGWKLLGEGD